MGYCPLLLQRSPDICGKPGQGTCRIVEKTPQNYRQFKCDFLFSVIVYPFVGKGEKKQNRVPFVKGRTLCAN